MLSKRVNNLCVQDKKRTENVPSGVPYFRGSVLLRNSVEKKKKRKKKKKKKKNPCVQTFDTFEMTNSEIFFFK